MIEEDDFELTDEQLERASCQICELWGAEVDEKLENLLEYQILDKDGIDSQQRQQVIIHYKPKKHFHDFYNEFEELQDFYKKRGEKFDFQPFDEFESLADESVEPLLQELQEPEVEIGEHLKLGNAVVAELTPEQIKKVAARGDVKRLEFDKPVIPELDESSKTLGVVNARTEGLVGTGQGIIIAVIDGEVDVNHPDLKGRVVHKRNYTKEPWGNPHPHGTHVAGIIAGNGSKYKGMAPKAIIWSYKIFPTDTSLSRESKGTDAIEDVIKDMKEGVRIANCSWGVKSATLNGKSICAKTAERAAKLGLVLVKSAGNEGRKPGHGNITCPADARGDVIVVGASSHDGTKVTNFSSRGPTVDNRPKPDILAPGEKIMSAKPSGGYQRMSGTSMATPHISGLVALILERYPQLKPWHIKKILMKSAKKLGSSEYDRNTQGKGLVDAVKALRLAGQPLLEEEQVTLESTVTERKLLDQVNIAVRNTGDETMRAVKAYLVTNGNGIKVTCDEQDYGTLRVGTGTTRDFEIVAPAKPGQYDLTLYVYFTTPTGEQKTQSHNIHYKVPSLSL